MILTVTSEVKARVRDRLNECIATIKTHYHVDLQYPSVRFEKGGTTAGVANYGTWSINFNPTLLMQNVDQFIHRTVAHELAHLAVERIYPEAHQRTYGQKRSLHGPRWQEIMTVLGAPVSRCHSYDVTDVARRKASYTYVCTACNHTYELGPKRHANLVRNPKHYRCRCGHSHMVLKGTKAPQSAPVVRQAPKKPVAAPASVSVAASMQYNSKFEHCYAIYKATCNTLTKDEIIHLFVEQVNMTAAGASTYYYKCKN